MIAFAKPLEPVPKAPNHTGRSGEGGSASRLVMRTSRMLGLVMRFVGVINILTYYLYLLSPPDPLSKPRLSTLNPLSPDC